MQDLRPGQRSRTYREEVCHALHTFDEPCGREIEEQIVADKEVKQLLVLRRHPVALTRHAIPRESLKNNSQCRTLIKFATAIYF